jgi:hypothetical protein
MPDSRQGSGTCLCHGAVMDRQVVSVDAQHEIVTLVVPDADLSGSQLWAAGRDVLADRRACHFHAAESGREVRALIASLLL